MPWDYLQTPVLQVRQRIAAHFLSECDNILEIGAFKTPITEYLTHRPKEVLIVDPLAEPLERDSLNGQPCRIRHLALGIDDLDLSEWNSKPFGLLFCGMDLNREEQAPAHWLNTVCRFVYLVSAAQPAVLEYPMQWKPSAKLFNAILSLLQPRLAADIRLDLTGYLPEGEVSDEVRSRFERRLVVLTEMERAASPDALRERTARILFGSTAAPYILGEATGRREEIADGIDWKGARLAYDKATIRVEKDAVWIVTAPAAWSYAAVLPFSQSALKLMSGRAIPAIVDLEVAIEAGEMGFGALRSSHQEISGERLIGASKERQQVRIFVPDARDHVGVICRNGQLNDTASTVRIYRASLSLLL
jgi:hypothetical protein